jgi:hypothetical protein
VQRCHGETGRVSVVAHGWNVDDRICRPVSGRREYCLTCAAVCGGGWVWNVGGRVGGGFVSTLLGPEGTPVWVSCSSGPGSGRSGLLSLPGLPGGGGGRGGRVSGCRVWGAGWGLSLGWCGPICLPNCCRLVCGMFVTMLLVDVVAGVCRVVVGGGCGVGVRSWFENCIVDASIFVAKLVRAHGGCLGTRSR